MPTVSRRPGAILIGILFMALSPSNDARAQSAQYGPDSSDIRQTVARVSYLSRTREATRPTNGSLPISTFP